MDRRVEMPIDIPIVRARRERAQRSLSFSSIKTSIPGAVALMGHPIPDVRSARRTDGSGKDMHDQAQGGRC